MKKVLAALFASLLLFSCTEKDTPISQMKIGILTEQNAQDYSAAALYYTEKACSGDQNIDYKIVHVNHAGEVESALAELVDWGAQAVISLPQWSSIIPFLENVVNSGVPVVVPGNYMESAKIAKILLDDDYIGAACARYVFGKIDKNAQIILLESPAGHAASEARKNSFVETMSQLAPHATIYSYEVPSDSRAQSALILASNPSASAVFAIDDTIALGALSALSELQSNDRDSLKTIVGVGGTQQLLEAIYEGKSVATAAYLPQFYSQAVKISCNIIVGLEKSDTEITIRAVMVYAENCAEYIEESPY